jgi:hypothetical protein
MRRKRPTSPNVNRYAAAMVRQSAILPTVAPSNVPRRNVARNWRVRQAGSPRIWRLKRPHLFGRIVGDAMRSRTEGWWVWPGCSPPWAPGRC